MHMLVVKCFFFFSFLFVHFFFFLCVWPLTATLTKSLDAAHHRCTRTASSYLLFSKVDSNKVWHDIQHEENVICAKFGKDLFNISKVIGRKIVAQFF